MLVGSSSYDCRGVLSLFTPRDDIPFELFGFLRSIPEAEARESTVSFVASDNSVVKCRLIALRKSAASAEVSRGKVLSDRERKGRSIDPRSLEAAEYIILLTNLEADKLSCYQALEIYRLRWQIEITFKRFKSLLNLDHLAAREPRMVQTYVLAKILGALLIEDLTDRYLSFFPWGYPLRSTSRSLSGGFIDWSVTLSSQSSSDHQNPPCSRPPPSLEDSGFPDAEEDCRVNPHGQFANNLKPITRTLHRKLARMG